MLQGDLTTAYTYANYFAERKNSVSLSLQQGKRTSTESCRDLTSRCAKGDKSTPTTTKSRTKCRCNSNVCSWLSIAHIQLKSHKSLHRSMRRINILSMMAAAVTLINVARIKIASSVPPLKSPIFYIGHNIIPL